MTDEEFDASPVGICYAELQKERARSAKLRLALATLIGAVEMSVPFAVRDKERREAIEFARNTLLEGN